MSFNDETVVTNPVTGEQSHPQKSGRHYGFSSFMRLPALQNTNEKLEDLDIGVIGVPFDGGVTYRTGARLGPRALREKSTLTRTVNHHTKVAPFDLCRMRDLGDLPFRNQLDIDSSMEDIYEYYKILRKAGVAPLSIGGDHSISYPILKTLADKGPLAMIHIDAHVDTLGPLFGAKFHHGSPFYYATKEGLIDPNHCIQIGIRGSEHQSTESCSHTKGMRVIFMEEFEELGVDGVLNEVRKVVGDMPTYFTFDVDGLDPIYASGTGTPESGGISIREAYNLIRGCRGLNVVGADLVEIAPMYDPTEVTLTNSANLLFEIACLLSESIATQKAK